MGTRLVSRLPAVALSATGRAEVEQLCTALAGEPIRAVYSSPLERTMETAAPLADHHAIPVRVCDGLVEVDFGEWTGRTFSELEARADWRRFNEQRGTAVVPGGESAATVQARVVGCLSTLAERHAGETIAAVSHGDVIRAALLHYIGTPLDAWQQVEIAPASVSALDLSENGANVLYINREAVRTS